MRKELPQYVVEVLPFTKNPRDVINFSVNVTLQVTHFSQIFYTAEVHETDLLELGYLEELIENPCNELLLLYTLCEHGRMALRMEREILLPFNVEIFQNVLAEQQWLKGEIVIPPILFPTLESQVEPHLDEGEPFV